jgi:hemerythrin superfamily protein
VLARVLVAHAEAEEEEVYPTLHRTEAIDADEAEYGEHGTTQATSRS